jgi:hypothetical protein
MATPPVPVFHDGSTGGDALCVGKRCLAIFLCASELNREHAGFTVHERRNGRHQRIIIELPSYLCRYTPPTHHPSKPHKE